MPRQWCRRWVFFGLLAGSLAAAGLKPTVASAFRRTTQKPADQKAPAAPEFKDLDSFLKSLPAASVKPLDPPMALVLSAVPLGCLDELQPKPAARTYFWETTYRTVDSYDKTRAFYGCSDWHTAVNATWTVVKLLKQYPDLPASGLIREKLNDHLGRSNLEGELAYFRESANFERPYGYAWFLKLAAELATWKDPEASRWADNVAPLAKHFATSLITYLVDLERANKTASQANTAFALGQLLDYVAIARDTTLERAVGDTAKRFYLADVDCATDKEAATAELVSPCLAEASVMSRVLDRAAFAAWLDTFLPPAYSPKFKPLTTVSLDAGGGRGGGRGGRAGGRGGRGADAVDAVGAPPPEPPVGGERGAEQARPEPGRGATGSGQENADAQRPGDAQSPGGPGPGPGGFGGRGGVPVPPRATWTGLALTRADAFTRIASALPQSDARVVVFKRLATIHAEKGQQGLTDPVALDAPWLATYALPFLIGGGEK